MQIPYLNILLRDMEEKDIADEIRWHTAETAWADWDAPWEMEEVLATFDPEKHRQEELEWMSKPKPDHRVSLELDAEGVHIGSVNAYCLDENLDWKALEPGEDRMAQRWAVGIDICESAYWSGGWGARALTGYIHYHLKEGYTDLYTQTWSGNLRMIALAQKLGFRECKRKPGIRQVRGGTYDGLTFKLDVEAFERHRAKLERESLELYIPKMEDMAFRREMMENPATMAYNAGWEVSYPGYHPDTGCIDFPRSEWAEAHARLTGEMPHSFYAYLRERSSGAFMGEVNFSPSSDGPWCEMGVVLHAPYKGRCYGRAALTLLAEKAFADRGVPALRNTFEPERAAALAIHRDLGFREVGRDSMDRFGKPQELLVLELTREDYLRQRETEI